ncbi:MAG TPA: bifunctional diguanylate cyclase/phosphodiesterase [Bauldia sp.]|nr:bifunctional diguanylate cyclase/phosphodiesterase [Bauldia sp.]
MGTNHLATLTLVTDRDPHPAATDGAAPALANGGGRGPAASVHEILSAAGEVAYEWSIGDDRIEWGPNAPEVLGVRATQDIASGRLYAALTDPANLSSRHDVILNGTATDHGKGVPYEVEYTLLPSGLGGPRVIVEDTGRWFADGSGKPQRARGVVRVVNERREREQRLAFLSRYDELTGYFNRQHLLATLDDALNNAKRAHTSIAFLIIAVDSFRAINEAYGFETADQVFAAVARRIKSQLRDGDAIGRYSGNKLGIVLMNCDEKDMHIAAERFHATVRNGVITAGESSVAVTVSIGGVGLPRNARTLGEAMARAQESLHQARSRGYGRFVAYTPSPAEELRRRSNAALSSELVAALEGGRLKLFFQPVVDAAQRKPQFYEALVRLQRANGTFAPAADFIELCERLGLIRLVDSYTLAQTLSLLRNDRAARVSLNVSAETIGDGEWLSLLAESVARDRDIAGRLIIEITETAVIRNLDEVAHFIATLHDLGCLVAMDDFGAGFSSFRHLRTFGVDIVKIAGEFIRDLPHSRDDQAFVKALTQLARNFDIDVVAEWVQDEESAVLLQGYGVDMLQGTLISPAVETLPQDEVRPAEAAGR